jgi:hypothetical protein
MDERQIMSLRSEIVTTGAVSIETYVNGDGPNGRRHPIVWAETGALTSSR